MQTDTKPYHSNQIPQRFAKPTRWLILSGVAFLGLAAVCLLVSAFGMMSVFGDVSNSPEVPMPSDLSSGIQSATIPSLAIVPLCGLGVVLVVLGVVLQRND